MKDHRRRLNEAIKRPSRSIVERRVRDFFGFIEAINDSVENAARASAFVVAQKQLGWSEKKAALWAKDLTTNFERKGTIGGVMNAWWAFSNAQVQGTDRVVRALKDPKVQKATAAMVVGFALLDNLNRIWGGEDEDGESYYDKIPDYIKRNNLIVMTGDKGRYYTLPAPFVYSWFSSLGTSIGGVLSGNVSLGKAASDTIIGSLEATNPLGGAGGGDTPAEALTPENMIPMFSPTVIAPFSQLAVNRDFAGRAIAPTKFPGQIQSDAASHWPDSNPTAIAIASGLNELFGGSETVSSGITDVSPETMMHLLKAATGGLGATLGRTYDLIDKGEESSSKDIPLIRRIVRDPSEFRHKLQFRENLEEINRLHARYEELRADDPKKASSFKKSNAILGLRNRARALDRRRKRMEARGADPTSVLVAFNRDAFARSSPLR